MLKKLIIGSVVVLSAAAITAGTVMTVLHFNKNKTQVQEQKPEQKPEDNNQGNQDGNGNNQGNNQGNGENNQGNQEGNQPQTNPELAALKEVLNASAFVEPVKLQLPVEVILPTGTTQENVDNAVIEKEIIDSLVYTWSGAGTVPNISIINYNNGGYVVSLDSKANKFIDVYAQSIFGKTWSAIMNESNNVDFQNINKVDYGFRLVIAQDKQTAKLVPTFTEVFFAKQPSWLKENNFRVSLLENTNLISTLKLSFK